MKKRITSRHENIDWKRNNKIALRNFHGGCDFHDIVKTLLVRMIRRKHKTSTAVPIYTEFNPNEPNKSYPDIWMRIKNDVIVWEIQKEITKEWEEKMIKTYEDVGDLIIVPLKELSKNLDKLKEQLEVYVV